MSYYVFIVFYVSNVIDLVTVFPINRKINYTRVGYKVVATLL